MDTGAGKIFAINKPRGMSSARAVALVKHGLGAKKVGHAGTLDPLASGVLVIGVGRAATKKLFAEQQKEKEYVAEITFGVVSDTADAEGQLTTVPTAQPPSEKEIQQAVENFIGEIEQVPPIFSAVKVAGQAAYKYARRGQALTLKPRRVEIKSIKLLEYHWPRLRVQVVCGPGVYIRSLAHDLGQKLQCGGYLTYLERFRVGDFFLADAFFLEDLPQLQPHFPQEHIE